MIVGRNCNLKSKLQIYILLLLYKYIVHKLIPVIHFDSGLPHSVSSCVEVQ